MNFSLQIFFNDINHGYRAGILKKNSLWLLPLYIAMATYFYYEKVRRTTCTAIVSNLLKTIIVTFIYLWDRKGDCYCEKQLFSEAYCGLCQTSKMEYFGKKCIA